MSKFTFEVVKTADLETQGRYAEVIEAAQKLAPDESLKVAMEGKETRSIYVGLKYHLRNSKEFECNIVNKAVCIKRKKQESA
jgi:hypothetical protein